MLITLAIIGVVAAMTIPTLISNVSRKQHLTAFKKKYAEITEAIKLSTIENQEPTKWNYDLEDDEFFATYLAPYLKTTRCDDCWISYEPKGMWFEAPAYAAPEPGCFYNPSCFDYSLDDYESNKIDNLCCNSMLYYCTDNIDQFEVWYGHREVCQAWLDSQNPSNVPPEEPNEVYSLVNGTTLGIAKMDSFFYLYLDVNGTASPNKYGADKFLLTVIDNKVQPYGYGQSDLTTGEYGCSTEGNGMYCGAVIMQNNWDYPDDYPKL